MKHRWAWRIVTLPVLVIGIFLGACLIAFGWLDERFEFMERGVWLVDKTEEAWRIRSVDHRKA